MASLTDRRHGEKRKHEDDSDFQPDYRFKSSRNHGSSRNQDKRPWTKSDQARINHLQEEEEHREFLAQEGNFVLKQKRKAAEIRVKEGRARPIDWLTVTLRIIDSTKDLINDDEDEDDNFEFIAPESVFDGLSETDLRSLEKDIQDFIDLERNVKNREYWNTMKIICKDRRTKTGPQGPHHRTVGSVSSDVDQLLSPKSYEELQKLEKQIRRKLESNEPIDTDYWQQLLSSLLVYKAKAKLKNVYKSVMEAKLQKLREENARIAKSASQGQSLSSVFGLTERKFDEPFPLLQIDAKDRSLGMIDEKDFLDDILKDRQRILGMRYVPSKQNETKSSMASGQLNIPLSLQDDHNLGDVQTGPSLFDKDVARGIEEDEEIFAGEEVVETKNKDSWMSRHRPRKPKYFNRVQMGYEWNKYNQTHYDHDNPPPKVVQGYKFHIFYPELIDKTKAPTYKITREGGRKKGQTLAPAGEEDTCIIRFISGAPYEDIAFRIIDRDWDYSAKHDRGFKSTFDNGVLTLHFSFKRVYYRK